MMINYSNPLMIRLRTFGRTLGVLRPAVVFYRRYLGSGYESRFDQHMMSSILPGDVVWDVGANVGHFTERFLAVVGAKGRVVAFEPSPTALAGLCKHFLGSREGRLTIEKMALGDKNQSVTFWYSTEEGASVTDGMGFKEGAESTVVEVVTGDSYLNSHPELAPSCIKVDVEGFEYDVLSGMEELLKAPQLRAIFVEVHFEHSARRGMADAPNAVVDILKKNGFAIKWVDPSHIVAER